jgi:hypothetical protein
LSQVVTVRLEELNELACVLIREAKHDAVFAMFCGVLGDPLTMQWWGDRTFKVLDPNGYEIWFYTNVAEPTPPQGAKLV